MNVREGGKIETASGPPFLLCLSNYMSAMSYTGHPSDIHAVQFRDLCDTRLARKILNELLAIEYFHYIRELSDIWLLVGFDFRESEKSILLAWAWITPWHTAPEGSLAIRMIDVPEAQRGNNYARKLIAKAEEMLECDQFPEGVIPSARDFWLKAGYDEELWL